MVNLKKIEELKAKLEQKKKDAQVAKEYSELKAEEEELNKEIAKAQELAEEDTVKGKFKAGMKRAGGIFAKGAVATAKGTLKVGQAISEVATGAVEAEEAGRRKAKRKKRRKKSKKDSWSHSNLLDGWK